MGFGDVLKQYINDTNDKMIESDVATNAFVRGDDINSLSQVKVCKGQ
ncbi:MAG: flagellar hook-basal body complex protein FliE [Clostridium butyricum]|nr:flagellar hook-basal body complex protein FliE [Clostridium butyricum]MDU4658990.1 flagellar hook-basal body complex protein FliE [Clostridium butyricum]